MTTIPFEHLLASHMKRVHRAALGWMGEEQEAREVAQEALLKAFRAGCWRGISPASELNTFSR